MRSTAGNEYADAPVAAEATVSGWHIALIKIGVVIALPAFVMGAQIGAALGLRRAALAMTIGAAVLAVLAAATGTVAARSRLATPLILRHALGSAGARVAAALIALTLLGWFGVTAELFGESLARLSTPLVGIEIPAAVGVAIGGALMVLTTIVGFAGLQKLSVPATPLLLAGLVALAVAAVDDAPAGIWSTPATTGYGLGAGISAVIGALVAGITIFPDLARFARAPGDARGAAALSYGVGVPLVLLLAALPAIAMAEPDLVVLMGRLGFGVPAFAFLVLTAWTTNSGNLYSAALGFAALLPGAGFRTTAAVVGAFGVAFALVGIGDHLLPLLLAISVAIPPIAGIYLTDFFVLRAGSYAVDEPPPRVRWHAFGAWGIAIAVAATTAAGHLTLTGVPACDAILVAAACNAALGKLAMRSRPVELAR